MLVNEQVYKNSLLASCIDSQNFVLQIFPCKDFPTFPDALAEVARQEVFQANLPKAAAFAVAGPVANNRCEMTNLSWVIDGDYLSNTHGIRCSQQTFQCSFSIESLGE